MRPSSPWQMASVLALAASLTVLPPGAAAGATSASCGDILETLHRKPPGLRFIGCEYLPDRQGKPLEATYRIPGRLAARAERLLARSVGLPRLRRSCCQWDAQPHSFRGMDGRSHDIVMVSTETAARTRAAWASIPFFEVTVTTYTEEI